MQSEGLAVRPLKTSVFKRNQDLEEFVVSHLEKLFHEKQSLERQILVITSKIISLAEGQIASRSENTKEDLIRAEADLYLGEVGQACHLTIKHGLLILTSGIDLSNSENGDYILLPKDPFASAQRLHSRLKKKFDLKEFGILISDSRTLPLRVGVLGCGLSCFGFKPIQNLIGQPDIFGSTLKMTQINLLDAIAGAAVMMMGEASEQTPLALVSGAPVEFSDESPLRDLQIEMSEDLYYPMYRDLIIQNNFKKKEKK